MNYKNFIGCGVLVGLLQACATNTGVSTAQIDISPNSVKQYATVQEMMDKKQLNQEKGNAKEYIYDWGKGENDKSPQSLLPRQYLTAYCKAYNGKFSLKSKSAMSLIKDSATKKRLSSYASVTQGIGAFQCIQQNGQSWIVSIEPVAERKQTPNQEIRVVALISKVVSANEAKKLATAKTTPPPESKVVASPSAVKTSVKETKVQEEKTVKPVETTPSAETRQQQQQRLYLAARRDLNRGQNQLAACTQAEQAYNLGRFYNSSGPNIYAESGILVAKCLTSITTYSKKFANPKGRAKTILQEIVNTQNHAVAKHMLQQLK